MEILNNVATKSVLESVNQNQPTGNYVLAVLVAGSGADTQWQTAKLVEELSPSPCEVITDSAESLLQELKTATLPRGSLTFRAHLLPSRTMAFIEQATNAGFQVQSHAGNGIVIAHAPEDLPSIDQAQELINPLRQLAESHHGSLVIQRCPADWKSTLDVFGTGHSSWSLMEDFKRSLDPHNLLSPGRLFAVQG